MNRKKFIDRIGKAVLILGLIFSSGSIFTVSGQKSAGTLIFDGRGESVSSSAPLTSAEHRLVEKEVREKETVIKEKSGLECSDGEFTIAGSAVGSFTKPSRVQKAVLYELCRSGRSFGIGGVVVLENGKIVSHFTYGENGLNSDIASLADINGNGLSEIVLIGGGTGQGYSITAVEIVEIAPDGVNSFGIADAYKDDFGTEKAKKSATAYRISAQKGTNPVYYRKTYIRRSANGKWSPVKSAQRFSLRKDFIPKYNRIF